MRVVIDALPMRGDSLSIVVEHLLEGWVQTDLGDELHIVVGPDPQCAFPEGVTVHSVPFGRSSFASRLHAQSVLVPRLCRSLGADVMLGVLPTTTITHLPCPRAIIVYDMRYKLRPEHFGWKSLLLRRFSYAIGFRQADAMVCISERTRKDLLRFKPWLKRRPMRVAHLGADHVDSWTVTADRAATPYAIAFGHYANKNVDVVLDAWALRHQRGEISLPLSLIGVSSSDRPTLEARIAELGVEGFVSISPWLPIEDFRSLFASAGLVVFPSDFEGFGLPAAEAMRLGIPVVITPDPALLEVTAGHATVMDDHTPEALVRAVNAAAATAEEALTSARAHAQRFTWSEFARSTHWLLGEAVASARTSRARHGQPVPQALAAPRRAEHPIRRGSVRWLGAAAVGGLLVSGVAAASITLVVDHHSDPPPTHSTTTTTVAGNTGAGTGGGTAPTQVNTSGPSTSTSTSTSTSSGLTTTTGSTSTNSASGGGSSHITIPPVNTQVPSIPLPPVTIPTMPSLVCAGIPAGAGLTIKPCGLAVTSATCRCP
jgi:glycosyltransferase involved in cell wall biosynthesis